MAKLNEPDLRGEFMSIDPGTPAADTGGKSTARLTAKAFLATNCKLVSSTCVFTRLIHNA